MAILNLNYDCLSLILENLDFDSISEMRKTCKLFNSAPLTKLEKTIINCGDFIHPRQEEGIKCDHRECWDLVAQRIKSNKTKKARFVQNLSHESFEYLHKFLQINPDSLHDKSVRNLFEYGIIFGSVDIVLNTYKIVFHQLEEYHQEADDYELYRLDLQGMYYKRALANFGYDFNVSELIENFNIREYPEWDEDEEYVCFDETDLDEIDSVFQGYHLRRSM